MHQPEYILERHPHGWLVKAPEGAGGIPMQALKEFSPLMGKHAVMDPGISHFYQAVLAIGLPSDCVKWRAKIDLWLWDNVPDQLERWLRGCDIGSSSAAIAYVLSGRIDWSGMGRHGDAPIDADDFGRCERLLNLFPDWRARLPEVAAAFPAGDWPKLVPAWESLRQLPADQRTAALRELRKA